MQTPDLGTKEGCKIENANLIFWWMLRGGATSVQGGELGRSHKSAYLLFLLNFEGWDHNDGTGEGVISWSLCRCSGSHRRELC